MLTLIYNPCTFMRLIIFIEVSSALERKGVCECLQATLNPKP